MQFDNNVIGNRIYELRKLNGHTLEYVGGFVGVSKATVKKWEDGEIKNIKRDKIELLSRLFRVNPAYLLGVTDDIGNANVPTNREENRIETIPFTEVSSLLGRVTEKESKLYLLSNDFVNVVEFSKKPKNFDLLMKVVQLKDEHIEIASKLFDSFIEH